MANIDLNSLTPEQIAMLQKSVKDIPPQEGNESVKAEEPVAENTEKPAPEPTQEEPSKVEEQVVVAEEPQPVIEPKPEPEAAVAEEVKPEPVNTLSDKFEDRHEQSDVLLENKKVTTVEKLEDIIETQPMPGTSIKKLGEYINKINDALTGEYTDPVTGENRPFSKEIDNVYKSEKDQTSIIRNNSASTYGTFEDAFFDTVNDDPNSFVNDINYSDKKLNPRKINFDPNTKVSGNAAIARFTALLGIGEVVQIPLWHSGIWVTIEPPKQKDIINLQIALTENQITLGRKSVGLIYSNECVIYNRIVANFIKQHIIESTLKLPDGDDLFEYISIQDFFPLILGVLTAMYPDGISHTRACINTYELDEKNMPKCDNIVKAILDPRKLLWLDRKALSNKLLEHMSSKQPNSKSIDAVKEYRASIERLKPRDITIKTSNEKTVEMTLALPTLREYIDKGEYWIEKVIKEAETLFTDDDTTETKNNKIGDILVTVYMGIYNSYVKKIKIDTTELDINSENGLQDIQGILDLISLDNEAFIEFRNKVMEYINESVLAVVGMPNYECEKCSAQQVTDENKKHRNFKEIIPLNILEPFFDLCGHRIQKARSKTI